MTEPEIKNSRDPRALNAYRHGLTSQSLILTPEKQAAYEMHCQGILASLAPDGDLEIELAQAVADGRWRIKHSAAIQSALFAMDLPGPESPGGDPETAALFAQARTWLAHGKEIQLLGLYEHRIHRQVEKNLNALRQLQAMRHTALHRVAAEAVILIQQSENTQQTADLERDLPPEAMPPQFVFSKPLIERLARYKILLGNPISDPPPMKWEVVWQ